MLASRFCLVQVDVHTAAKTLFALSATVTLYTLKGPAWFCTLFLILRCRNISIALIIPQKGEGKAHACDTAC